MPAILLPDAPPLPRGRHRQPQTGERHATRFSIFAAIGGGVFLAGLAAQVALVRILHMAATPAYVLAGAASIQLSFLLNRYLTWRDRGAGFWVALWKWNTQKAAATAINMAAYAVLVRLGVQYVVANVALTAVFTPANYLLGHYWSFARPPRPAAVVAAPARYAVCAELDATELPTVSVVIPCKNSQATILATVAALLGQDYPNLDEVIVVGGYNDPTYAALNGVRDPRLIILEQEPTPGRRDPNVKRDKGIRKASGEIIALADSDIVMGPHWLSAAVQRLTEQGGGLVAGGMRSISDTFWGRFVDRNALAAKTPRLDKPYQVTAQNFGRRGFKPPISANAVFTREMYDACPLDRDWAYGYEDYEWFWRLAKEGHEIFYTGELTAAHHHRRDFRGLFREYRRAAHGCAHYVRAHPDSPLARKRRTQAVVLPLAAVAGLVALGGAATAGYASATAGAVAASAVTLMGLEFARTRTAESVLYPFLTLPLAAAFTAQLSATLAAATVTDVRRGTPYRTGGAPAVAASRPGGRWHPAAWFAAVIGAGIVLRLWQLSTKPNWQMDEVTYTALGTNVMRYRTVSLPLSFHEPWRPFLFHPPFYFLLLGRWFALTGPSVFHARILGVAFTAATFTMLAALAWKLHGRQAALFATALVVVDGWLLYVQRVSYMENILMAMIAGLLLVYLRALRSHSWGWYVGAGAAAGACVIFKHVGAYILLLLAVHWLLTRRDTWKHLALLAAASGVVVAYEYVMIYHLGWLVPPPSWWHSRKLVDTGGHNWYLEQSSTQLRRVLGLQHSGGSLTSVSEFVHLITNQYIVFVPSLATALAALIWLGALLGRGAVRRSLTGLGEDRLIPAWCIAGVVAFGAIALKYSQYFELVLIPLYLFLWTRLWPKLDGRRLLTAGVIAAVMAGGLTTYTLRVFHSYQNAYGEAGAYVADHVPLDALVISAPPISYEIPQARCSFNGRYLSRVCLAKSTYIVTWQTYLQAANPYRYKPLAKLLLTSRMLAQFRSFSGVARVWQLAPRPAVAARKRRLHRIHYHHHYHRYHRKVIAS